MPVVEVTCPHCGARLKAPEERIGKKAKCKRCREPFRVPGPIPMAESVGEPEMLSTLGMPAPALPDDDEDDKTELMAADQLPPLPPMPPPKAKPAPPPPLPAKDIAALPSADPFDFGKPAFGAAKVPPPAALPAPAAPKAPPPAPLPTPAASKAALPPSKSTPAAAALPPTEPEKPRPVAKARPLAKPPEPEPEPEPVEADADPFAGGFTDPEPPKSAKTKAKKAAPEPELAPAATNPFSFGLSDAPDEAEEKSERPKKAKRRDEEDEEEEPPRKKKKRDDDEEEAEEKPRKKKKRDDEEDEDEKPRKKKRNAEEDDGEEEAKPRYQRPEEKGGMAKAILLTGVAGGLALVLGIAAIVVYVRANRPVEQAKEEKKKEDPIPEAPPVVPVPVPKVDPKKPKDPEPKPKDKEPDPKPKDKEPEPKPKDKQPDPGLTREPLEFEGKFSTFTVGKQPAKFETADKPAEPRFILDTPFAAVLRVFPAFDLKTADTYVVTRNGPKLSLDGYSPSSQTRVSRLDFTADTTKPICDLYAGATSAHFLAVSDGRLSIWNLEDKKLLTDAIDPYAGKPEHQKNGIAAAFFSPNPIQIVIVSTAGAVHLFDVVTKTMVSEFVPPHGARGKVVFGTSVDRAEGSGSIVLTVGGILYQIRSAPDLELLRKHDLGGDVKPLAVAASGTPGRLLFVFDTDGKTRKDRALFYLPPGAGAKPSYFLWPSGGGIPKSAFWVNDTSVGVGTDRGVVWLDEELNKFAPVVVTQPTNGGLYLGAKNLFWYVVPHPSKPAQSVLVPLPVPFGDAFDFRSDYETKKPLRIVRIDPNGLAK